MTNCLLAYNLIPYQAKDITPSYTENSLFPVWNLLTNKRSDFVAIGASGWSIIFDLGLDSAGADIEKACEFILLANATTTLPSSGTFYLDYSDDNISYSNATSFTNTDASAALKGLMRADYIKTFTATSAHRYWKIRTATTTSEGLSKCYFGTFLDFEVEPNDIKDDFERQKFFIADGGYSTYGISQPEIRKYKLEWKGITKAKLAEFESIIKTLPRNPLFFIYLQTVTDILNGENLVAVTLVDYDYEFLSDDYINLTIDFKDSY